MNSTDIDGTPILMFRLEEIVELEKILRMAAPALVKMQKFLKETLPDPEIVAKSLADFKVGNFLSTEEWVDQLETD